MVPATRLPCLVPVQRLSRPSQSMHFGDVSETNGREMPRQSCKPDSEALVMWLLDVRGVQEMPKNLNLKFYNYMYVSIKGSKEYYFLMG